MFEIPLLLILIVLVALVFDFTNGAHDCANAIATVVSTKVVTPRFAVGMAAALNLAGALLGTEVAKTLGAGLVLPEVVQGSHILVLAALLGAIFWNCLTWYFGIPSSSSHALIGGLVGAALAHAGPDALNFAGIVNKVLLPLVLTVPALPLAPPPVPTTTPSRPRSWTTMTTRTTSDVRVQQGRLPERPAGSLRC